MKGKKDTNIKSKNGNEENLAAKKYPKWFYFIPFLIPIIFIVLLEVFLRIINYGNSYEEFIPLTNQYPDEIVLNPRIAAKYFNNLKNLPAPSPDTFTRIKKENSFRIFVLGESSAQGWPYVSTASFSSDLRRRLQLLYPSKFIEVVNLGISAINTYTIRDILPGVLEQKPDLILIYTGHNEYYGALGPGSAVSMGKFRSLINIYISLEKFRTTQLLRNIIQKIWAIFTSENKSGLGDKETLMGRVIGESAIPLNSETYSLGISQFKGNMEDILSMCKGKNVPVIIGTLTCNLRDINPFISISGVGLPPADSIYNEAKKDLDNKEIQKAKKLFEYAKDLDGLRFRAPSAINEVIRSLAKKYNYPLLDIDSVFESNSPDGIVGFNLTVDHLHPNIEGYQIMANAFYRDMEKLNLLPAGKLDIPAAKQDSILNTNFPFTRLDSTIAKIRIAILTGSYPFKPKGTPNLALDTLKLYNFIDSLAMENAYQRIGWEKAHLEVADWYYKQKKYDAFIKELRPLMDQFYFDTAPYEYLTKQLIEVKEYVRALPLLYKYYRMIPTFYSSRWIGTINLNMSNIPEALKYLKIASGYKDADPVLLYNLSGAYYLNGQYRESMETINKCLQMSPNYKAAQGFKLQLENFMKSNKITY